MRRPAPLKGCPGGSLRSQKVDDLCAALQSRLEANPKYTAPHRRRLHVGPHSDRMPLNTSTQYFVLDSCCTLKATDEASDCFTDSCVCTFINKDFTFKKCSSQFIFLSPIN